MGLNPDHDNLRRAAAAARALDAYRLANRDHVDDGSLCDLVTDLGHFADQNHIDFLDVLATAIGCWALEQQDPERRGAPPLVTIHINHEPRRRTIMSTTKRKKKEKVADYAALAALGISKVEIIYDGCSDQGCIEEVTAYDAAGCVIEMMPDKPITITVRDTVWNEATQKYEPHLIERQVLPYDAIQHWCYGLLADYFPGWEIDDGSSGTIIFDVKKRCGRLEHGARYTETVSYSRRFA